MTRFVRLAVTALALVSCSRASDRTEPSAPLSPPAPTPAAPAPSVPVQKDPAMTDKLTFSLARAGAKLRVSYRYENLGRAVVHVHDAMLQQVGDQQWKRLEIQMWRRTSPDTAVIQVGLPEPEGVAPPRGTYLAVQPGASVEGTREVPFPLTEPDGTPMQGITQVSLDLEVIAGDPGSPLVLPTDKGPVTVPDGPDTRLVHAAAVALPK